MTLGLVYLNVNEDGYVYGLHDSLDAAVPMLAEYPNDTITVKLSHPLHHTDCDAYQAWLDDQPEGAFGCNCGCAASLAEGADLSDYHEVAY